MIDQATWKRILALHMRAIGHQNVMSHDNVHFLSLALCGEAGELANIVKKHWRGDGQLGAAALDEVADIVTYAAILYCALGGDTMHREGLCANINRKLDIFENKLAAMSR